MLTYGSAPLIRYSEIELEGLSSESTCKLEPKLKTHLKILDLNNIEEISRKSKTAITKSAHASVYMLEKLIQNSNL